MLEVTLRTPAALDAIAEMRKIEGAVVGAGTVLNPDQLGQSLGAGAEFIVSPGLTEPLGRAAIASGIPFLPGIATAGDLMRGLDLGLSHFKFFPAETSGGIPALKALAGPFGDARFCPTGGITQASARPGSSSTRCSASAARGWFRRAGRTPPKSKASPAPPHRFGAEGSRRLDKSARLS